MPRLSISLRTRARIYTFIPHIFFDIILNDSFFFFGGKVNEIHKFDANISFDCYSALLLQKTNIFQQNISIFNEKAESYSRHTNTHTYKNKQIKNVYFSKEILEKGEETQRNIFDVSMIDIFFLMY